MDAAASGDSISGFYGVFDGHGGREVARFCSRHMLEVWRSTKGLKDGKIAESLAEAYLSMDVLMRTENSYQELQELSKKPERDEGLDGDDGDADQMGVSQAQIKQLLMGRAMHHKLSSPGVCACVCSRTRRIFDISPLNDDAPLNM